MGRHRSLWDAQGKYAEFEDDVVTWLRDDKKQANKVSSLGAPIIMRDIQPYQNMIDGRIITSRSEHRSLLKQHNCVEVGNDTSHMKPRTPQHNFKDRKRVLASQLANFSDRDISNLIGSEIKRRKH